MQSKVRTVIILVTNVFIICVIFIFPKFESFAVHSQKKVYCRVSYISGQFLMHSTDRVKEEDHSLGAVDCKVANKATEDPISEKTCKISKVH